MSSPSEAVGAGDAGERLDRGVGHAEQDPGGGAEHHAVVLDRAAHARAHDQQAADEEQARLEGDHPGVREVRVRAVHGGQGDAEQDEPAGGQHQADPLALADLETEHALGHHRDEHDAGGERDLDDRHRRQREGRDVQAPARRGDAMPRQNHFEEYSADR